MKPEEGQTVGCTLTVANDGGNNVTRVVVNVAATGGTFVSTDEASRCSGLTTGTLSCSIPKLAAGAMFIETHELQVPSSGTEVVQTVTGRYSSPSGNNRGSPEIPSSEVTTLLNNSDNFDGRHANSNGESVQTAGELSEDNPYVSSATMNGTTFAVGVTVHELPAEANNINCPCLGDESIEFNITELVDELPDTYTLVIKIAGDVVGNTKVEDLVLKHNGNVVPFSPTGALTDPDGAFMFDRIKVNSTKDATLFVTGPGDGNGGWGVGGPS